MPFPESRLRIVEIDMAGSTFLKEEDHILRLGGKVRPLRFGRGGGQEISERDRAQRSGQGPEEFTPLLDGWQVHIYSRVRNSSRLRSALASVVQAADSARGTPTIPVGNSFAADA